jgi:hypothetical protein
MWREVVTDSEPQRNPADLPLVTFDNNALIALRQDDENAPAVREILAMNRAGLITANVTAMTGMEAQREEERLEWQDHITWIASLGIARANIFTHPRSIGFSVPEFPDGPTFDPRLETALGMHLHDVLFPNRPREWWEYCRRGCEDRHLTELQYRAVLELDGLLYGLRFPAIRTPVLDALSGTEREELTGLLKELHRRWFNAFSDVEGLRIHSSLACYTTHPQHAVFVTSDKNFRKKTKLDALRAINFPGEILPPAEAATFLRTVTGMLNSTELGS